MVWSPGVLLLLLSSVGAEVNTASNSTDIGASRTTPTARRRLAPAKSKGAQKPKGASKLKGAPNGWYFMHIPKTGGTSLEIALCGGRGECHSGFKRTCPEGPAPLRTASKELQKFPQNHVPQDEMIACGMVTAEYFASRKTLCTVREPTSRFLSEAAHRHSADDRAIMMECIEVANKVAAKDPTLKLGEWTHYTHCRPMVDFTGPNGERCDAIFDTNQLSTDGMRFVRQHIRADATIPSSGHNPHKVEKVSDEVQAWIESYYAEDISLYGRLAEIQRTKPLHAMRRR